MRTRIDRRAASLAAVPVLTLVLAACGSAAGANHGTAVGKTGPQGQTAAAARRTGATVAIRASQYGRILVDGSGRTLYLFTRESGPQSKCYGDCASAWPPYLTTGAPIAKGAQAALLGTTRRTDGSLQVTYRGHPLYYFIDDHKAGDITCQATPEFGGTWYVVAPSGTAIR
jgi:predicted lipoprotein with Yx(FWY)xxD motif